MTIASDTPVLDTLAAITAESVERCGLDDNSLLAARIAALVAVDAPAASYLVHIGPAADAGVTLEQLHDIPDCGCADRRHATNDVRRRTDHQGTWDRDRRRRDRARRRAGGIGI